MRTPPMRHPRHQKARPLALSMLALSIVTMSTACAASEPKTNPSDKTAERCDSQTRYAIIVHGGTAKAGRIPQERLDFLRTLLNQASADLREGGEALDAVEFLVKGMEDSGLFNAGRGAIANAGGFVETDASIMDGRTMNAGAVASMLHLKNPISAARLVMAQTRHVLMVGDRGEQAVTDLGAKTVSSDYFLNNKHDEPAEHGTVGAAVLDRCGNLAAGTSTGGYDAKMPGRVGDSPVIGASTYAKNGLVAASATGHGEYFIRFTATRSLAARMEFANMPIDEAAQASIDEMYAAGDGTSGRGGIIAVDAEGNFAMPYSYDGMVRATARDDQPVRVGVFEDMQE